MKPPRAAVLAIGLSVVGRRGAKAAEGPGDTRGLPCRPTIACTADIVVPGAVEIEAGSLTRSLGASRQETFPFLAKLTLAKWIQVQVGSNGYTAVRGPAPASYFDNMTVGAKAHVLDQGDYRPAVSVSAAASAPVASQDGQSLYADAFFTGYVTKDLGPVHADLNVGLNAWRLNADAASQGWIALALSTSLPPPFGLMLENYYFTGAGAAASHDGGVLFAVSHSPRPWLTFDAGGDVGYFPATRAFSAFVGMTLVPVLLWRS